MKTHEWHSRRTELSDELAELEQASGISPEDSEKAWFGQLKLMPALDPTPVRDLYFGVADSVARKGLIVKATELRELHDRMRREDVDDCNRAVRDARQKESRSPWIAPSLGGVFCVLIGNAIYGVVGAICGAVVAVFVGLHYIIAEISDRRSMTAEAQAN